MVTDSGNLAGLVVRCTEERYENKCAAAHDKKITFRG